MSLLTVSHIEQFLTEEKVGEIQAVPADLELTSTEEVFGRLRTLPLPVHLWTTTGTTPSLVLSIIAMKVAGRMYLRSYANQSTDESSYGIFLLKEADKLVTMILNGTIVIDEELAPVSPRDLISPVTEPIFSITRVW